MMAQLLQILAVTTAVAGLASAALASGSGEDGKENVETRLLKILKDRGVLKESEFNELVNLGKQMRDQELLTTAALDKEIRDLAERIAAQGDAKKAAPETKLSYKWGKGVTVSQGEDFAMTLGGRIQSRFSIIDADGATSKGQDDRGSFDIRRARFKVDGYVMEKNLEYLLQFDLTGSPALRDAYINYRFMPEFQLRTGMMKRPFSRQNWTSSGDLQFPDRVNVVERFRSMAGDRDTGLLAWGELGDKKEVEWYVGVYNGEGLNNGTPNQVALGPNSTGLNTAGSSNNDSSGLEAVARLAFNPMGAPGYGEGDLDITQDAKLGFAAQYSYNPERLGNPMALAGIPAGTNPRYDVHTMGGDMVFRYQGIYFTAEAYYRETSPAGRLDDAPTAIHTTTETGWFAQGSYFFGEEKGKGPEFAARWGSVDYDNDLAPATGAFSGITKVDDYTGAFNYYFGGHSLKLQFAYTYRNANVRSTDVDNQHQIFQVQLQVKF
jgi:phosphate-selective porin